MITRTTIRLLLAALLCVAIAAPRQALAAAPPASEAPPQVSFPPEIEKRLSEVLDQSRAAKGRQWDERMSRELDEVTRLTGLDEAARKGLQPLVAELVASSLREWQPKFRAWLRNYLSPYADEVETAGQLLSQTEMLTNMDWFGGYHRPFEDPRWREGLRRVLTPEQDAALEKASAGKKAAIAKETGEILQRAIEQTRAQQEAPLLTMCEAIEATLNLTEERAAELRALARQAVAAPLEKVRARAARNLLAMEESQRQQVVASGQLGVPFEESDHEAQRTAWEAGLARVLSPVEQIRVRATQDEHTDLQIRTMARVLLTRLDESVAFTAAQRGPLLPLLERALRGDPSVLPDAGSPGFLRFNLPKFIAVARRVEAKDLAAILDTAQQARWQEACSGQGLALQPFGIGMRVLGAAPAAVPATPSRKVDDAEELERAISDHLYEQSLKEQRRLLAMHLLKVEDVARTAALSADASATLATAARGAAEAELAAWKPRFEQNIRAQLRDTPPEYIEQRLASLTRFSVIGQREGNPEARALWDATVQAVLTEAQQAAWQKQLDARAAYRDGTIVTLMMTELHRMVGLSKEQRRQLESRLATVMKEYGPDASALFSYNPSSWYLQGYPLFVLLNGIPETEFRAIFTKAQWEQWSQSSAYQQSKQYWDNVQRLHQNRMRTKTP